MLNRMLNRKVYRFNYIIFLKLIYKIIITRMSLQIIVYQIITNCLLLINFKSIFWVNFSEQAVGNNSLKSMLKSIFRSTEPLLYEMIKTELVKHFPFRWDILSFSLPAAIFPAQRKTRFGWKETHGGSCNPRLLSGVLDVLPWHYLFIAQ